MELKLFSNSAATASNLSAEIRERMEAKVQAERPDIQSKGAALAYLLECALDQKTVEVVKTDEETAKKLQETEKSLQEANSKNEAYKVENEYLKSELSKKPAPIFSGDFEKNLRQIAFLGHRNGFIDEPSIDKLVRKVFAHYMSLGNFIFTEEDKKILQENGLL